MKNAGLFPTWRSGMRCVEASVSMPLRLRRIAFMSPWSVSVNHCCSHAHAVSQ